VHAGAHGGRILEATAMKDSSPPGPTTPERRVDPVVLVGYAIGSGVVFVASLGVYVNYWRPALETWQWAGGTFLVGALVGALVALLRRPQV
jgi:hypothetical protein